MAEISASVDAVHEQSCITTSPQERECVSSVDLKTLLMHGTLHETAAAETFHQVLLDVSGQRQAGFQGSASLVGTKMVLHNSKQGSRSGRIQFSSALRWADGFCASVEVLGLAPGSDLLFALKTPHDDAQWELDETAATGVVLDAGAPLPPLSGLGLAVRVSMLDIDRPVADVAVWANTGGGWAQRTACRTTTPEPFVLELVCQQGDVLATFSDVFMRKVKCPALRVPGLGTQLLRAAACPAPALFPVLAATSMSQPEPVDAAAAGAESAPAGGITETPGDAKPFACPDGKRFTTRRNAERWLEKSTAAMASKLQAPAEGDANAVMQHMAAAEEAAQALDAADAASKRPTVVISCPQLTITSPCTYSTVRTADELLPLALQALQRCAGALAQPLHAQLANALQPNSSPAAVCAVLQSITQHDADAWPSAWADLQRGALWGVDSPPADVESVAASLAALAAGTPVHVDVRTIEGQHTWELTQAT